MVLAKDKNEEEAMRWLIRSVHLYPMNWGCWLEMTSLISRVEDVSTHFLALKIANQCQAQSNISAPSPKYPLVYLSSAHFPRTLSVNALALQLLEPTPVDIPNESFPPYMSCSPGLSYQRLHYRRCPL